MNSYEHDRAVLDGTNPGTDRLAYRHLEALDVEALPLP